MRIGKYRVVARLGVGGMADVVLGVAERTGLGQLVALKRLHQHLAEDPELVSMLLDESRLTARLTHRNIVQTLGVGEEDGAVFIAMEYVEGQPLSRLRRKLHTQGARMSLEAQVLLLAEVLAGLHHAHELTDYDGVPLCVVHRDVSPSNVLVTYDGIPKLSDFGVVLAARRATTTRSGVRKGKITYMAPEQAAAGHLDRRADIFAVGVMLWEAATGRRMWEGMDDVVILGRLLHGEAPRHPRDIVPTLNREIDRICAKALAKDPEQRYARARDFQDDLETFLGKSGRRSARKAICAHMNQAFAEERTWMTTVVRERLADLRRHPHATPPPLDLSDAGVATPRSWTATEISPADAPSRVPQQIEDADDESSSLRVRFSSAPAPAGDGALEEVYRFSSRPAPAAAEHGGDRRGDRSRLLYIIVVAALLAGAMVWFFTARRPDARSATSAATSPAEPATVAPSVEDERVSVILRGSPPELTFRIDEGPPLENPYVGRFLTEATVHRIIAEAPGFIAKRFELSFEQDVRLDVALEPVTQRPETSAQPDAQGESRPEEKASDLLPADPWGAERPSSSEP